MQLLGRDAELGQLRDVVEAGGAVVLEGRPGVGKSALLEAALTGAGVRATLRATGVQSEIELPYAGLRQLLDPVLDEIDQLPPAQRSALRAALALDAPQGIDRGTVLHATAALIGALAPVVVAVDDLQWLDESSVAAIAFVARRARRLGAAVIAVHSLRGAPLVGWDDVPTRAVEELGRTDALTLAQRAGVAAAVADALVRAVGGNPLALIEGPAELTDAQRSGREALPAPLPAGRSVTAAYAARLARLPAGTRAALLLAAASSDDAVAPVLAALPDGGAAVLEPAEDDGIVTVDARVVRFVHPEARSAVYHAAAPSERRAAHRALAAVLPAPERAWHLAVAADRPDEGLAAALEAAAYDAVARGAPGAALHGLRRAATLTPDPGQARTRTLTAGHLALLAGQPDTALALATELPPAPDDAARADTQLLVGAATAQSGRAAEAQALLEAEAERIAAADPARAAGLLTQAAIALMGSGPVDLVARIAARARALAPPGADLVPAIMEASARAVSGEHAAARDLLDARLDEIRALDPSAPGHEVIALAAMCLHWMEEQDRAIRLIAPAVQTLRDRGAVTPLAFPLVVLVSVHTRRGDFRGAARLADEAAALGEEAIGPFLQAMSLNTRAFVAAHLDEGDVCVANAERARVICERLGIDSHRAVAEQSLGMLALARGELRTAIAHLERSRIARRRYGARDPGYTFNEADLTEAYIRAGRTADAHRALEELREGARLTGGAWATAAAARYAALLGPADTLDEHLAVATAAHARIGFPFEEARTKLVFGERLRRARRRAEARALLAEAEATFRSQGAVRWAARAAAELAAAGGGGRVGTAGAVGVTDPRLDELTAREREVCAIVARGATNAEVAAALFVSPRTVEHHLRLAYRKLGVRSRSELAARFAAAPVESPMR